MRDILSTLETWRQQGEQIGLATVIETWGSSPRPVGSRLAVTLGGGIAGSVSAGCVENAVIQEAWEAIKSGSPKLLRYGVSNETAFEAGLTCGGTIRILVEPFSAYEKLYALVRDKLEGREPFGLVSVLDGPPELRSRKLAVLEDGGVAGDLELPEAVVRAVRERLAHPEGFAFEAGGLQLFADCFPRIPRLVVVGAVHIAEFLAPMATLAGYEVVIVDPRAAFATPARFPGVAAIHRKWPDEALEALALDSASYVAVLSHDPKLDDPALRAALASKARYVGVLGSRRSVQQRLERLKELGLEEAQLARLRAPIGLPLGGRSAVEIAVSILAEVIQARNAKD